MATIYKPLTPRLRDEIQASINDAIRELKTCNQNPLVTMQINSYNALQHLFDCLPDGYLVPMRKEADNGKN